MDELFAIRGDPDQKPHSAVSNLDLHYLPNTLLGVSQWVNKAKLLYSSRKTSLCIYIAGDRPSLLVYTIFGPEQLQKHEYLMS